jgi:hypothetical protein
VAIIWISWGVAPGCINIAPLGLFSWGLSYFGFSKSPIYSLLEYTNFGFDLCDIKNALRSYFAMRVNDSGADYQLKT